MGQNQSVLDPDGDLLVILCNPSSTTGLCEDPESSSLGTAAVVGSYSDSDSDCDIHIDIHKEAELTPPGSEVPSEWHCKVSSKHLALASPYFKAMLNGPWREATEIHEDGLRHWEVEDFNPHAMSIVLSIIHCKNHLVPQLLGLDMLVEVARIVDYLKCYEATELYGSLWIRSLEDNIPTSYNNELLHWICIACVFREDKIFERCTRVAILENQQEIPTLGLPVLAQVSDLINQRRMHHLDEIFASVYSLKDKLTQETKCSFNCDAMRLGYLTKYMHANALGSCPIRPYTGLSVASVIETFKSNLPVAIEKKQEVPRSRPRLHCGFKELIATMITLESEIQGLDLKHDWASSRHTDEIAHKVGG
ncbi:hypothetical protein F4824DRAFT_511972 [Ustulina deusta]|nr:hypothetical protein F4824DRAFT_511972 [Ustulina deusta]